MAYDLKAEAVVISVGRQAGSDGLGLKELKVATEKGNIVVNERLETGISGIFAIGDVIGGHMLAHVAMHEGRYRLVGDGSNWTSRIHVDDLAAVAEAALASDHEGAFPVADDRPAPAREVASFVAGLLGCAMPEAADASAAHETLRTTRKVDGRAIRELLGVALRYPDYEVGIRASL